MRTTITFDDDVAAAIDAARRSSGAGVSEIVNQLVRKGLAAPSAARPRFKQRTHALGLKVDITNVAEVLEMLDELDDE